MSKITKTTELTDDQLDKVVGGKPDWDGNTNNQNLNQRTKYTNLNVNQKTNLFTRLLSFFGLNQNSNFFVPTNKNSITNQFENTNANINANTNINQNQNEN